MRPLEAEALERCPVLPNSAGLSGHRRIDRPVSSPGHRRSGSRSQRQGRPFPVLGGGFVAVVWAWESAPAKGNTRPGAGTPRAAARPGPRRLSRPRDKGPRRRRASLRCLRHPRRAVFARFERDAAMADGASQPAPSERGALRDTRRLESGRGPVLSSDRESSTGLCPPRPVSRRVRGASTPCKGDARPTPGPSDDS